MIANIKLPKTFRFANGAAIDLENRKHRREIMKGGKNLAINQSKGGDTRMDSSPEHDESVTDQSPVEVDETLPDPSAPAPTTDEAEPVDEDPESVDESK